MRIKIIPNPKKRWAQRISHQVRSLLLKHGHSLTEKNPDTTICIGGDGTILYANHMGMLEGSVLGIGGKASFICQIKNSSWRKELLDSLRKHRTEKLMTLEARAGKRYAALNDFVVHTPDYRVVTIHLSIGGEEYSFEGDGVIVSSAVGSASYAYSAGGRKLRPAAKKITVVPICPYKRAFRPMVIEPDEKVRIRCDRESAFIVDGMFIRHLKKNERITVTGNGFLKFFTGVGKHGF
ncbi:TPA: NAD(+)/NADH kinase [Candidatus Micrarchaeota archaeon]|nr:NAD(+)/NADH kinase [Candidatus Micrarchaeota archaeon]